MTDSPTPPGRPRRGPTPAQRAWLMRGLDQPGGKLPLFDPNGRRVDSGMIRRCIARGWVEPWFRNPTKPDWLVCRLSAQGRALAEAWRRRGEEPSVENLVDKP